MTTTPQVLTTEEAAEFLRTTPETVRKLVANGTLPRIKHGQSYVFHQQVLIDYLTTPKPVMAQPAQSGRARRKRL